jgi:two-component system nitrate/nitrite response regulator NarL
VYDGGVYFHEAVLQQIALQSDIKKQAADVGITQREKQIITLIEKSLSNKEIASSLNISVQTVETHRKNIFAKTRCNNPLSLVKWALEHGIIDKH